MESVNPAPSPDYGQEAGSFLAIMDEMAPQLGLDYSVESLQRLDQFISEHFEQSGSNFANEDLPRRIGCYVGEVIIRQLGGYWNDEGRPEINGLGSDSIYPIERAQQRFKMGRQESLAWYYHSIAKHLYETGFHPEDSPAYPQHDDFVAPEGPGIFALLKGMFKK